MRGEKLAAILASYKMTDKCMCHENDRPASTFRYRVAGLMSGAQRARKIVLTLLAA